MKRDPKAAAARIAPRQPLEPAVVEQTVRKHSNVVKPISASVSEAQQQPG
ncbi:hypothetical protein [Accumulibacter sp.]|nr:hypothetical protein [Accumulibacter sp.]MCM8624388.1 hypothetical protein [Accumulibacter sp.]